MAMSTTLEKHQPMLLTLLTVYRITGSPCPQTKGWLLQLSYSIGWFLEPYSNLIVGRFSDTKGEIIKTE